MTVRDDVYDSCDDPLAAVCRIREAAPAVAVAHCAPLRVALA
jgi:hypothetical protein